MELTNTIQPNYDEEKKIIVLSEYKFFRLLKHGKRRKKL